MLYIKFKHALLVTLATSAGLASAQTNIFPADGRVGIGTTQPADLLHLNAGSLRKGLTISSDGDPFVYTDIQLGIANKTNIPAGQPISWWIGHRKDGYFSNSQTGSSSLEFYATRQVGGTHEYFAPLSFKSNGDVILVSEKNAGAANVGIGTTDTRGFKLAVNGKILATEIKVATVSNWPDYVFRPGHRRLSLADTEQHILRYGRLPETPSAEQVEKEGIELAEMNKLLLKKIEELTLHLIDQGKQIEALKKQISKP